MVESEELILDIAANVKKLVLIFLEAVLLNLYPFLVSEKYRETREEGIEWLSK